MFIVAGAHALSSFKTAQITQKLQAIAPVTQVTAQFVYFFDEPLAPHHIQRAEALLNDGQHFEIFTAEAGTQAQVVITPRMGTISPWSSKANDIFTNSELPVSRVERGIVYTLSGISDINPALVAVLHDRMTESTFV